VVLRRVMPCWDTRRLFERHKMPGTSSNAAPTNKFKT
jgi:hypothetical protein